MCIILLDSSLSSVSECVYFQTIFTQLSYRDMCCLNFQKIVIQLCLDFYGVNVCRVLSPTCFPHTEIQQYLTRQICIPPLLFFFILLERRKLLPLWLLRSYQEESLFFPSQAAVIAMLHWGTSTEPLDLSDRKLSVIKKTSATASAFPSGPVKKVSHVNPGVLVSNFQDEHHPTVTFT